MEEQDRKKPFSQSNPGDLDETVDKVCSQHEDTELRALLRQWCLPRSSPDFDRRVLTAYRKQVSRTGRWKRLFLRPVPVPLPIAAALLLLIVLAARNVLSPTVVRLEVPPPAPEVARVEVPVVREKIVTRTVYRQAPETKNTGQSLKNDTAISTSGPASRPPQSSQAAVRLDDFEPVEKIHLKILKSKE
jgi:hypothetical protein